MVRKTYLDIAKGLAMICIFLGHLSIYDIDRVVYTFMVTVFFIITGYFISTKRDVKNFIFDKFKKLIIPYIFVSCVCCILGVLLNELVYGGVDSKGVAWMWIKAMLFGTGASGITFIGHDVPAIGAIWFLLATFFGAVALRILLELKPIIRAILVCLILLLSINTTSIIFLPWSLQPSGVALFFMYVGFLWRKIEPYYENISKGMKVGLVVLAAICWLEMIVNFQWFLLVLALVGDGLTDIFQSICGCYVVLEISKMLDKNIFIKNFFSFIGEYSIIFLSVHLVELFFFPKTEIQTALIHVGLSETISLISVVLVRFLIIMSFTALLSKCNIIRKIYGFSKKEKNHE